MWAAGILIVLVLALYFVGTSSAFFKGVILPRVSASLHADVTVSDASIHPFNEIILLDLKIQPKGQEPVVTVPEVRLRYSLFDIIRGNLHVDEVALRSPAVHIVENPDGSSNLDPLLKTQERKPQQPEKQAAPQPKPSKPAQIDLRKLMLNNATVRKEKLYIGGTRDLMELNNINVTLENVKNGQTGKLTLGCDIQVVNNPPSPANKGAIQAALNGSFSFTLSPDLKPASVLGQLQFLVSRADGALNDMAAFSATLNCEVTPTDIKQVALRFQKSNEPLGELLVSGPFDAAKTEGRLKIELLSLDKRVLNLLGAKSGVDFGTTAITSTNDIQLAKSGSSITATGRFDASHVQLSRRAQITPTMDFHVSYDVAVDRAENNAILGVLRLTGTANGRPFLKGDLTSPMTLAWGNATNAVGDSSLDLTVTGFDLADWKPFLGDIVAAGEVDLKAHLGSKQGGQQLTFDLDSQISNLSARVGSNQITRATVTFQARGQAAGLKQFNLDKCKLQVSQQSQSALTVSGSGKYDVGDQSADLQVALQASLANLFQVLPQPDMTSSAGTAELKVHLVQKQKIQTVSGNLALDNFTGKIGKNEFRSFGSMVDIDVSMTPEQVKIGKIAGKLTQAGNAGGSFSVSGSYDLTGKSSELNAVLADFNQDGLRPFLEPLLADKRLVSVSINGNALVQYDPIGSSAIKADLQVTNLVVSDPKQQFPATPLEAKLEVDTSLQKQSADVRQFRVTLTPTQRAQNQLQLQGHVDFSQTNAIQGNVQLAADSLDLTSYYDLFAGKKPGTPNATAHAAPGTAPGSVPSQSNEEPTAMQLPFRNFAMQATIGRLYLHEVEITNLQTTLNLDGGHVLLKPCRLTLNGAPVTATADLDLAVPGFKYDVTFTAHTVPLAPLVNSFQPDRAGQIGGSFTANAMVKGAGMTGSSLQKYLTGQFDVGATNLNLSIINLRSPLLKTLINVIATVPELLSNPESAIASLFGGITGRGGLANDLNKSPLDVIAARGVLGGGRVDLQQAVVRSPAFEANAQGSITIAKVLTNSVIQIPIGVSLSRPIADRLNLVPANAPVDAAYVPLPKFLTMTRTVGNPKADVNKLALAGTALRTVVPGTGGKTGGLIKGIGGLLEGQPSGSSGSTNTNQSPVNNLLNRFLRVK
jgi:hypothetical protein